MIVFKNLAALVDECNGYNPSPGFDFESAKQAVLEYVCANVQEPERPKGGQSTRLSEEAFSNIASAYRAWPATDIEGVSRAFEALFKVVCEAVDEAEQSAVNALRERDAALDEVEALKQQISADLRRHPDFVKLAESEHKRAAFCNYWEQMADIQDERLALAAREIALLKSR